MVLKLLQHNLKYLFEVYGSLILQNECLITSKINSQVTIIIFTYVWLLKANLSKQIFTFCKVSFFTTLCFGYSDQSKKTDMGSEASSLYSDL